LDFGTKAFCAGRTKDALFHQVVSTKMSESSSSMPLSPDAGGAARERAARRIARQLVDNGHQALFAGGYVRDLFMGGAGRGDIDIATDAAPERIARIFPRTMGVGEHFGVMIVVEDGMPFEVATFRADKGIADGRRPAQIEFTNAKEDAARRDFTINGLFLDPGTGDIIDYVGGRDDLKRRVVRAIGDPALRFAEDYLRLLRAVRFSARFDFIIEPATWAALIAAREGIRRISAERIFQELDKMLCGPHADRAMDLLRQSGLLAIILPEVDALAGVAQPAEYHPEGDVLAHTLKTLSFLESPSSVLAWSALLHDIGKPSTMRVSDRIRFNNHHIAGAAMAGDILKRLKASNEFIANVVACIDNHMNFMNVTKMRLATLKKLLSRPTFADELALHRIDCQASHGGLENWDFLKIKREELSAEMVKPPPLLRGQDLIDRGLAPGPCFRTILNEAYDLQLEEKFTDRESACEWLRERIRNRGEHPSTGSAA
jgi:poly(A) polymerase